MPQKAARGQQQHGAAYTPHTIWNPDLSFSDKRIIEVLAAPAKMHRRLVEVSDQVPKILKEGDSRISVELYGSLALDIGNRKVLKSDWAGYYVNQRSDIDFVVEMPPGVKPSAVIERFVQRGPWRITGQVQVHRFASTQFTLLGLFEDDDSSSGDESPRGKASSSPRREKKSSPRQEKANSKGDNNNNKAAAAAAAVAAAAAAAAAREKQQEKEQKKEEKAEEEMEKDKEKEREREVEKEREKSPDIEQEQERQRARDKDEAKVQNEAEEKSKEKELPREQEKAKSPSGEETPREEETPSIEETTSGEDTTSSEETPSGEETPSVEETNSGEDATTTSGEDTTSGQHTPRRKKYSEVFLDITCIESNVHFTRFRKRQKAFRNVFSEVRRTVEGYFGANGVLAFDAYIHLLKAFAAKLPGSALTGFQATCIGLFTLQIGHFKLKPTYSLALSFFEGFLRFCIFFYGDSPHSWNFSYRQYAIDLSHGGRWISRQCWGWRSELYFMAAEESMKCPFDERVNVAHSLDPTLVSQEANSLLQRSFTSHHPLFAKGAGGGGGRPARDGGDD